MVYSRSMPLISQETVGAVKASVDVVEVVSSYLALKKAGANMKGLCPFHEEKTPSFNVNPERQIYKCFGCGKAGDAVSFIMEMERTDYPDAIRILAEKTGIPVKYADGAEPEFSREDLFRANEWAAGVYRSLLKSAPEAEAARSFLASRGVSEESAETFGLGYSPDSWDQLLGRARRAGMSERLLGAAGLLVERDGGGHYDRFRGRLMFPIENAQGRVAGFGARTLKDETPKFINTPDTSVFSKGRGLYGLRLAKDEISERGVVAVVEGYMDVIVPRQHGVGGIVATLGTALTVDHLKILRRHAMKVVLVFDADVAGRKAAERGLDMLLAESGVDVHVAELPEGMDPDDVVLKLGRAALDERLARPREVFEFLMESLVRRHGTETPSAKARIVDEVLSRVATVPDPVKRALLVQQLAEKFSLDEAMLRGRAGPGPRANLPPSASEHAAAEILSAMAASPDAAAWVAANVPLGRFPAGALASIAEAAYDLARSPGGLSGRGLLAALADPTLAEPAAAVLSTEIPEVEALTRVRSAARTLLDGALRGRRNPFAPRAEDGLPPETLDRTRLSG